MPPIPLAQRRAHGADPLQHTKAPVVMRVYDWDVAHADESPDDTWEVADSALASADELAEFFPLDETETDITETEEALDKRLRHEVVGDVPPSWSSRGARQHRRTTGARHGTWDCSCTWTTSTDLARRPAFETFFARLGDEVHFKGGDINDIGISCDQLKRLRTKFEFGIKLLRNPRYLQYVLDALKLTDANDATTSGVPGHKVPLGTTPELKQPEASLYRSCVEALLDYTHMTVLTVRTKCQCGVVSWDVRRMVVSQCSRDLLAT